MKKTAAFLMALGLALPAMTWAQDSGDNRPPRRDRPPRVDGGAPRDGAPGQSGGPGGDRAGRRPPPPPLFGALDVNRDGMLDEVEINQAPESLRKLDKNGDGKLTLDELRPPRPEGQPDGQPGGSRDDNNGARPHSGPRPPQQSAPQQ